MVRLRSKIFSIAFGDVIGRGLGVITSIYLARVLGAESYGVIAIAMSVLGYLIWTSDLGLLNIGAREIAKIPEKRIFRAREIFYVKVILGLLVVLGTYFMLPLFNLDSTKSDVILTFTYSIIPYALLLEWYYNGRQQFGRVALSKILNNGIYLTGVLIFIKSVQDLELVPFLYTIGVSVAALVLGTFALLKSPFELPSRGWPVYKDLIWSAGTVGLGWFFTQVIVLLPPLVIGIFISDESAGFYAAAVRIIFIAMMLDRVFVNLLIPNLSAIWSENRESAKRHLRTVYRIMLTLGGFLTLLIALLSPEIIRILYTNEYESSIILLSILSFLLFATFQNSIFTLGLVALGKDRDFFHSTTKSGLISAVIIIVAASTEDLRLVAMAVVVSEFLIAGVSMIKFNQLLKLEVFKPITITLVSLAVLITASHFAEFNVYIEVIVAGVIFIGISFLSGILNMEHVQWLKTKLS